MHHNENINEIDLFSKLPRSLKYKVMEFVSIDNTEGRRSINNLTQLKELKATNKEYYKLCNDYQNKYGYPAKALNVIKEITALVENFIDTEKDDALKAYLTRFKPLLDTPTVKIDNFDSQTLLWFSEIEKTKNFFKTWGVNIEAFYDICHEILKAKYNDLADCYDASSEYFHTHQLTEKTLLDNHTKKFYINGDEKNYRKEISIKKVSINKEIISLANIDRKSIKKSAKFTSDHYRQNRDKIFNKDQHQNNRFNFINEFRNLLKKLRDLIHDNKINEVATHTLPSKAFLEPYTAMALSTTMTLALGIVGSVIYGVSTRLNCNYMSRYEDKYHIKNCAIILEKNIEQNPAWTNSQKEVVLSDALNEQGAQQLGLIFSGIFALTLPFTAYYIYRICRNKKLNKKEFALSKDELAIHDHDLLPNEDTPLLNKNNKQIEYYTLGFFHKDKDKDKAESKEVIVEKSIENENKNEKYTINLDGLYSDNDKGKEEIREDEIELDTQETKKINRRSK